MAEERLRLFAADDVLVPYRGPDGALVHNRYVGRERTPPFAPLPEGEEITTTSFNRGDLNRDVRRGHLSPTDPRDTKGEE